MTSLAFTIPGEARGWARARINTKGAFPVHFMDGKTRSFENLVKMAASVAMRGRSMIETPCELSLVIRKAPPASVSKKRRALMLDGAIRPGVKPDCSNIAKGIEDALNKIAYRDDALIVELKVSKIYAEVPGVDVTVTPIGEPSA